MFSYWPCGLCWFTRGAAVACVVSSPYAVHLHALDKGLQEEWSSVHPGLILIRENHIITKQCLSHWVVEAIAFRVCSHLWACERTWLGVWPHPGPYSGEFLFRTSVLQRVGPWLSLLTVSICWTSPLHAWHTQFCCPDWNKVSFPVGWWTWDKLVWQYGN